MTNPNAGRTCARALIVTVVAWLLAACTPYGRFTSVEVKPSPGAELQSGDEIRIKANYQINRYMPGVRYGAALFFSVSGGRTATAVKSQDILQLEKPSGTVDLAVPVSQITGPPLVLRNDAFVRLYILRYYGDEGGADPVVISASFHFKISDEAVSAAKWAPPTAAPGPSARK